jgi:hypothetical protein
METSDFDKKFDSGEVDISQFLDINKAQRTGLEAKQVNVYFFLMRSRLFFWIASSRKKTRDSQ